MSHNGSSMISTTFSSIHPSLDQSSTEYTWYILIHVMEAALEQLVVLKLLWMGIWYAITDRREGTHTSKVSMTTFLNAPFPHSLTASPLPPQISPEMCILTYLRPKTLDSIFGFLPRLAFTLQKLDPTTSSKSPRENHGEPSKPRSPPPIPPPRNLTPCS